MTENRNGRSRLGTSCKRREARFLDIKRSMIINIEKDKHSIGTVWIDFHFTDDGRRQMRQRERYHLERE